MCGCSHQSLTQSPSRPGTCHRDHPHSTPTPLLRSAFKHAFQFLLSHKGREVKNFHFEESHQVEKQMHGQEAEDPGTHLRMLGDARSEHGTSRTARRGFLVALGALSLAVVPGSSAFSVSLVGGWGATQQRVHALMPRCGGQPWGRKISSRKSFPCLALLLVQLRDAVRASLERTKLCTCRAVRAGDATAMELCPCALDPGQRRHFVAAQCASIPNVCMAGAAGSAFREDGWQDRRVRWESEREGEQ